MKISSWPGRTLRADKRGHIDHTLPPILTRLGIEETSWIESVTKFHVHFYYSVGAADKMEHYENARKLHYKPAATLDVIDSVSNQPRMHIKGIAASRRFFG